MFNKISVSSVLVLGAAAWPLSAAAIIHGFAAEPCTVGQEIPTPTVGSPSGSGVFDAVYDDVTNQLTWRVTWTGMTTSITMAHLHGPALQGVGPAGIQVDLGITGGTSGAATGVATLTAPQETMLFNSELYINLHTVSNGGGEIRGQLIEDAMTRSWANNSLNPTEEVLPSPVGAGAAIGSQDICYDETTNRLVYGMTWSNMTSTVSDMHFHGPAASGAVASPQIGISGFPTATSATMAGSHTLTALQETQLLSDLWYLNIHTVNNPSGEIRGQIDAPQTVPAELSAFQAD